MMSTQQQKEKQFNFSWSSVMRLFFAVMFFFGSSQLLVAQSSIDYDFNTANQLSSLFTVDGSGQYSVTKETTDGLSNSGSISVPLSSTDAVYTFKDAYSFGPEGNSYVFESFTTSEGNSGNSGAGFKTISIQAGLPVVFTPSYTSSSNAVTVNGNVTSENGSAVTERGIVYGTAAAPTLSNNKIASGAGTGTFSAVTPTLSPGTYFFRAYATNSSGTSYGAELTTNICSPNLPTLLFKLSPPDITTSAIQGQPGIRTENFNTQATGEIQASGTVANGTYTKTGPADRKVAIEPNAVWGGTESQYLSLMTNAVLNITLTDPSRYLGFWWGGGDDYNRVTIFGSCGGNEIQLGQFTTSSVTNLLAGPTVTAVDGNSYPSASYRRANAFNQPFAFINLELSDPNVYFTRMEVTQSGGGYFEIDNITSGTVYGAATYTTPSATTISSITAGGSLTVNFNAPSSNGGQPITNFEYSTNGGTNWVAASPVVTTSPLVISGLNIGTTYAVQIRAVNSIGYGPQSSAVNATPIAVAPVITSFTPTTAATGTTVTLTGTDFTGATAVSFGGTAATSFTVVSATSITAVIAGGTSGNVSVTTPGGTAVLAGFTFIPAPVITSFTPTSAGTGATVTLTGTNFTGATAVSFGGTAPSSFNVVSATSVTAVVAAGTSGNVSVTTPGGTAVLAGFTFIPAPVINSFSPASGPVGTLVNITGTNLGTPTAFTIGGTAAIVISNTGTSLVGMVMPGSASGTLSLTTAGGTVTSTGTFTLSTVPAPNTQQGAKLVGTGNTGAAGQGRTVSLSADGNTAIVGGYTDNSNQGAAWIYTRSGTTWTQQGAKLVGTGNTGAAGQGFAVSISADGNTAILGGYTDNSNQGAAWIFTRSGTTWSQQGAKLVGTGNTGAALQGNAVSLSADGNTAIVGGVTDNSFQGAAWIFTRSGTTWSQQGDKLVGTGNTDAARQGNAVSLSADGNTAIVGGVTDNSFQGAAWIFTRSGTTWSQQGAKLVGTGNTGAARQGFAVSISADGNTAILGGYTDNSFQGAAWIFTRSGTTWSQQGAKLVGTGNTGAARQGYAVSLSADGNTAVLGGLSDNSDQGAVWIFTRSGTTWTQQGTKLVGTGNTGAALQGKAVSLSADGTTAIVGGSGDNSDVGASWVYTYVPPPTITSATYNASTGVLVVTGTNLVATAGATNDIDATKLTFTGQGGSTFTLTSNTTNVEITNGTSFTVSLGATDKTSVNALLNKNGTSSIGGTTYTIAAADNWNPAMTGSADLSGNGITVSNVATITTTGTLTALTTIYATASSNTSFSVSGASLTNDITVTAPTGFEVSVSTTSGFGNAVTLTQTSGTVSITTVYVRLKSSSTVAGSPYSGDVTCTSTNAQTVNVATVSSTVTALGLTITGVTASNKEYDANTTATLGGTATLVGVATADQANVTLAGTATATFNNASVGISKAVTVTGYTLGGTAAGNYTVSQPTGLTANISAKALTITGITARNKEYDANTTATLGGTATLVGVETADQANVTLAGTAAATFNNASVGTSKAVTVTGYTLGGSAAGNYTVSQPTGLTANISAKAASTLSIDPIANQNYTGAAITPTVIVKDGATTLTLGTDYSVAYSNNINVGIATVTITGMGIYTGTKTQTFAIVSKAASTLSIDPITNLIYTGAAITPLPVVKDGNTTLTLGTDYSVACYNNTNAGPAKLTITGIGNYTGTKDEAFNILPKAVNTLNIDPITNLIYTGAAITPSPVVKDGNITLILGTDYSVSCYNNTNAGTATLTITGIGNYTSTKDEAFNILPKTVNTLSIDPITNLIYTGAAITPLSVVKDGSTILTLGTDYSVSCYNNTNAGTAKLTITGIGNYTGTKNEAFTILPKALTIRANNASKIYGDANPSLSFSYSGLVAGDTEIDQVPRISTVASTTSGVGNYRITLTGGSDPNYSLTLVEGVLDVTPAALSLAVNNATKIYGQVDPVYTYSLQGLKGLDTEAVLVGAFSREAGEDPGTYRINQGSLGAGANYTLTVTGASLQILKARALSVAELSLLTTAWSKEAALPATVKVLAAHGQDFQVEVKWDKSTLNLLARGIYSITGTLLLPVGIENPDQVLAKIKVQVLPKPAPRDVTITNNTFVGSTTAFFIPVGAFVINDPVDKIHVVSLLGKGYDNRYFEIKDNILFWNSADRAPGKTTFSIVIRVTDRDGNTLDKFFEIKRTRPDFSSVTIYNTFTPNGDRFNDTWGVPELRFYEGTRISVYERGGSRVFYTENPDVSWDGTYEGKELPVGTYYWVIQITETGVTRRGMVNLMRK